MSILNLVGCGLLGVLVAVSPGLSADNLGKGGSGENLSSQAKVFHQLIRTRRAIRRYQQQPVPLEVIRKIVDDARLAPSAGNQQPWRFVVVHKPELVQEMNRALTWLRGFAPASGEEPVAHIVVLGDAVNGAFAVANLVLSAHAYGIGTCIVGSVDWLRVQKLLNIPKKEPHFVVVALGYPLEKAVADTVTGKSGLKVWKDDNHTVHVPKKSLDEVMSVDKYAFH